MGSVDVEQRSVARGFGGSTRDRAEPGKEREQAFSDL